MSKQNRLSHPYLRLSQIEEELKNLHHKLEIERNIRNNLYAFIFIHGMFKELQDYAKKHDMKSPDGHLMAIEQLYLYLPENSN